MFLKPIFTWGAYSARSHTPPLPNRALPPNRALRPADRAPLQQGLEAAAESHGEGGTKERRRDGRRDGRGSRGARGAVKSENSEDAAGMWSLVGLGRFF
jgi:hypothetical protein